MKEVKKSYCVRNVMWKGRKDWSEEEEESSGQEGGIRKGLEQVITGTKRERKHIENDSYCEKR